MGRITVAAVAFAAATALFTAFGMSVPRVAVWIARVQLLPAALSFSMVIFVGWIIATLIFGRIYCSTVCPMGTLMDLCARTRRRFRHRQYHYKKPSPALRNVVLAVTAVSLMAGTTALAALIDPYSAFGRIAADIVRPAWAVVAAGSAKMAGASLLGFAIALATLLVVGLVARSRGRAICTSFCPVGTTLGLVSRYSIFHIDINTDKCIQCRKCEHACKSHCIDLESHVVDGARCVVCFDCLPVCPNDAISYTPQSHRLAMPMMIRAGRRRETAPTALDGLRRLDRRRFLAAGIVAAVAPVALRADRAARSLAAAGGKKMPSPEFPVCPPGAPDRKTFLSRCTACGLCVSHCSTGVLRPSLGEYGALNALRPVMRFDIAACSFDCSRCNNLCPTGALEPLTLAEKRQTVIGRANVIAGNCIGCGACAKACPRKAITMTQLASGHRLARVDEALCIGCGACQNVCPAYPYKAIYVDGLSQ